MNYKYYYTEESNVKELFRCPFNDKDISENIRDMEVFGNDGKWSHNTMRIRRLLNEIITGWVDESNQISENEAMRIINLKIKRLYD